TWPNRRTVRLGACHGPPAAANATARAITKRIRGFYRRAPGVPQQPHSPPPHPDLGAGTSSTHRHSSTPVRYSPHASELRLREWVTTAEFASSASNGQLSIKADRVRDRRFQRQQRFGRWYDFRCTFLRGVSSMPGARSRVASLVAVVAVSAAVAAAQTRI